MGRSRVTVTDVAHARRMQRPPGSDALTRPEIVKPASLARVRAAVAELGYRPMPAARLLRSGQSRTIAFALSTNPNGIADRFLHALTSAAQDRDHRALLFAAGSDNEDIRQYEQLLTGSVVDAFVLADTHRDDRRTAWLASQGARFAAFGRPWGDGTETHAWVDVDGAAGTRAAVEHLAAIGHNRIGSVGWPAGSGAGDDRRAGGAEAVDAKGGAPRG